MVIFLSALTMSVAWQWYGTKGKYDLSMGSLRIVWIFASAASICARTFPEQVGVPRGPTRRRTPGLRREEVAMLAGVSLTWP